jgi:hypothetical protein
LDTEEGFNKLMFWLNARTPRALIIDPLRNFHSLNENDSGEMINMIAPLRAWAVDHEAALIIVHHTSKPTENQKEYDALNMRGTGAFFGMSDGILMFTPKGEFGRMQVKATFKRAKGWESTINVDVFGSGKGGREELSDLDREVIGLFQAKETNLDAIRAQLHVSKIAIVVACARLERAGLLKKLGRSWILQRKKQ